MREIGWLVFVLCVVALSARGAEPVRVIEFTYQRGAFEHLYSETRGWVREGPVFVLKTKAGLSTQGRRRLTSAQVEQMMDVILRAPPLTTPLAPGGGIEEANCVLRLGGDIEASTSPHAPGRFGVWHIRARGRAWASDSGEITRLLSGWVGRETFP